MMIDVIFVGAFTLKVSIGFNGRNQHKGRLAAPLLMYLPPFFGICLGVKTPSARILVSPPETNKKGAHRRPSISITAGFRNLFRGQILLA
jgi:hypothetical protein